MIWRPTKLTREQMEEQCLEGERLLRGGKLTKADTIAPIARSLLCRRGFPWRPVYPAISYFVYRP
jgi:hypothetical protein